MAKKFLFCLAVLILTACSGASFSSKTAVAPSSTQSTDPSNPTCVPVADITRLTKILFVVDTSGSNAEWIDPTTNSTCTTNGNVGCTPPTDPNKAFRLGSIQNFLNQYASKKNFQWGFITFADESTQNYIAPNGGPSFTSDPQQMQKALNSFALSSDNGDTPYGLSLSAATQAILNDKDRNSSKNPQYFVILLTDGYPTDFTKPSDAKPYLASLLAAASNEVNLSTIFYGAQNIASSLPAMSMLSGMASLGGGQFANVNNPSSGINISDVIPGHACP